MCAKDDLLLLLSEKRCNTKIFFRLFGLIANFEPVMRYGYITIYFYQYPSQVMGSLFDCSQIFIAVAAALRHSGLGPVRPPRTARVKRSLQEELLVTGVAKYSHSLFIIYQHACVTARRCQTRFLACDGIFRD